MVGDKLREKDSVIIYSNIELVNGGTAGSARVMNYARALAVNCNVILLTYQRNNDIRYDKIEEVETGIYTAGIKGKENKLLNKFFYAFFILSFLHNISKFSEQFEGRVRSFLLYPSTKILLDFLSVIYLIKIKRYRVFYEINEVRRFSSNLYDKKGIYSFYKKSLYFFSERLSGYFSGLLCISTNIEKYYQRYNENTIRIPILSNIKNLTNVQRKELLVNETFRIGFFGSVSYEKENFDLFFQSLLALKKNCINEKFNVALYGQISKETKKILPEKLKEYNLEDTVKYCGKLEQNSVLSVMKDFHLLVLPRGNNLQNKYGFSTKLSEYLMSGVPVLVTDVSDNSLYLKDGVNGFIVPPDDMDAFSKRLCYIINNYNDYMNIGKNAHETAVKNFNYSLYSDKLKEFLC